MATCDDFQFHGNLAEIDPDVAELIACEAERQTRKLIMIPSESDAADGRAGSARQRVPKRLRRRLPRSDHARARPRTGF